MAMRRNTAMPRINLDELKRVMSPEDYALVVGIVNSRTGELRASKPAVPNMVKVADPTDAIRGYRWEYANDADAAKGKTAYIWRQVAFAISPIRQHQCMPVTDIFDLPGDYDSRRALAKVLDEVADVVVKTVPVTQWHGVIRWGNALGVLGSPSVGASGAFVYTGIEPNENTARFTGRDNG